MCGFVALVAPQASQQRALLATMAHALEHRGPDGEGVYANGPVAMHHKRLAVIDPAGGAQPMVVGDVAIAFNGEIYNYLELRDELIKLGHSFRTQSDTEVLLRAWLEWGEAAIARLNGMFAFVLHDRRKRLLIAARDHFGIKPLYWMRLGETIWFGSEIKALLRHPDAPRGLDPVAMEDYLSLQFVLGSRTMFEGISKIEPAHFLRIDTATQSISVQRYWEPDFNHVDVTPGTRDIEEVAELLEASVKRQMRSDVPVGAYLSGGLDSSLVASLASRHTPHRLETFTGAFHEGPEFDETQHAQAVADYIGAQRHTIYPSDSDFVSSLPRLAYYMDEPAAGPGLFPQFMVSRKARDHVTVCLGGQGGDEMFVGYARYLIGSLEEALLDSIAGRPATENTLSLSNLEHCLGTLNNYLPLMDRIWRQGLHKVPSDQRYFRIINRLDASETLLSEHWRERMQRSDVRERFGAVFNRPSDASHLKRMLHFDLVANLPTLLHVEDRASMAASLESRVPLLCPDLAQRVARLPDRTLLSGGFSKSVLRQVARDHLPASVVNRTDKMGFPVPLQRWIKGPAREFVSDVLLSRRARERGIFCPEQLENLIGNEFEFGRTLWGALQIELWHQTFIDQRQVELLAA